MTRCVYVNGKFLQRRNAKVDIEDRGFNFGDAVYEVIFLNNGILVDEDEHLNRLEYSLSELSIPLPKPRRILSLLIREVVRLNRITNGFVYLQVTRGVSPRDHLIPNNITPGLVIMARSSNLIAKPSIRDGVSVITAPDLRWHRRDIKTTQLIANCLAKSDAVKAGAGEAWMVDENGFITEGSSSNAWIVTSNREILTRPPSNEILNGITRRTIIALAKEERLKLHERGFTTSEALKADEAFFTSATSLATPVTSIDGHKIGSGKVGPVTKKLQALYIKFSGFQKE